MRKVLSMVLMTCLAITLQGKEVLASSSGNGNESATLTKYEMVLQEAGFDANSLSNMPNDKKIKIAESILNDPSSVEIRKEILHIDNIAIFEYYTNTEDSELIKNGLSIDEIRKIRNSLNEINSLTKEQFKDRYSSGDEEYKIIKKALTKNPNYKAKKDQNNIVTTSGTISSSDLYYYMTKSTISTSHPEYDFYIYFDWTKPYFNDIFDDTVAAAWGGNLNVKNINSYVDYYRGTYWDGSYGGYYGSSAMNYTQTPNMGIVFTFPQHYGDSVIGDYRQAKSGWIQYTLYQTQFQGYETNAISKYCHKIVALSFGGVSIAKGGSGVQINTNTNYQTSPEPYITLKY